MAVRGAWFQPARVSTNGVNGGGSSSDGRPPELSKHCAPGQRPRRQHSLEGGGRPGVRRRSRVGGWKQTQGKMTKSCRSVPKYMERKSCRGQRCSQRSASHTHFGGSRAGIPHCRKRGSPRRNERNPFDVCTCTEAPQSRGAPCARGEIPSSTLMEIQRERGSATMRRGSPPRTIRQMMPRRRRPCV